MSSRIIRGRGCLAPGPRCRFSLRSLSTRGAPGRGGQQQLQKMWYRWLGNSVVTRMGAPKKNYLIIYVIKYSLCIYIYIHIYHYVYHYTYHIIYIITSLYIIIYHYITIYIYIYHYISLNNDIYIYIYIYTCMCVWWYILQYLSIYIYTYVNICIYIYIYVFIFVFIYYTYTYLPIRSGKLGLLTTPFRPWCHFFVVTFGQTCSKDSLPGGLRWQRKTHQHTYFPCIKRV